MAVIGFVPPEFFAQKTVPSAYRARDDWFRDSLPLQTPAGLVTSSASRQNPATGLFMADSSDYSEATQQTGQPGVSPKPQRGSWEWSRAVLRKILTVYIVVVIVLAFLQRSLLYHPSRAKDLRVARYQDVTKLFPDASDVRIHCEDGVEIGGWLLQREQKESRPLVIHFHGNAGDRTRRISWYQILRQLDVNVLAVDYHGYADSGGTATEDTLEIDAQAAWKYATQELGYSPDRIIITGTSLGGAVAVYLTARQCEANEAPAGLATLCTFSSMVDTAGYHYPWLPVGAILVDRFPSEDRISSVTCPVLMLHGDQDTVVPQRLGEKLFRAAPGRSKSGQEKRWMNLPDAGHNDVIAIGGREILNELAAFRAKVISPLKNEKDR